MTLANPVSGWVLLPIVIGAAIVAWMAYSRWSLSPRRRIALVLVRFVTLMALVVFLLRPVASADLDTHAVVVPILVDTSKSMSIEDAAKGVRRIDRARQLVADSLLPALGSRFTVEVLGFGEALTPLALDQFSATGRRSDLAGALDAVRARFRGRAVAGVVLLSDGGDTGGGVEESAEGLPAIFAVGLGSPGAKDREILGVTAADRILDDSRVDLAVSAVSHGFGRAAMELRLLENGRAIDVRRVVPAADGAPVREVFQVSPGSNAPTVYTVDTPAADGELVPENNARSVLVTPPSRRRRVLLVEGAPGFEHSFLKRAWASDTGLEVDSVVKKGKDEKGANTFYIQAGRTRGDDLAGGYPRDRGALFQYDAVVLANVEGHQLTRAQLETTQAFVARRGGGLLVLGARSFLRQGLGDTALEEVLPLAIAGQGSDTALRPGRAGPERGDDVVPAAGAREANRVALTAAGDAHPVMQLAPAADETRRQWDALPALASTSALGGPRPGASVLAIASGSSGAPRPLVAVQRYGEGRSMIFTGEASWRWRMMMPAANRAYDTFWKQALRWVTLGAGDPIHISAAPGGVPGEPLPIRIVVRDAAFESQADATVDVRITSPDGRGDLLRAVPDTSTDGAGHYVASARPAVPGIFKVSVEARRGAANLGSAGASLLVGGADPEMTDPRLNQPLLQRLADASGGRLLSHDRLGDLPGLLRDAVPQTRATATRDLWHAGWTFGAILTLLGAEWILRRRWGLR